MEGGDKILVMDSSKDLPSNWQELDMKKEFGISESPIDLTEVSVLSIVSIIEKPRGSLNRNRFRHNFLNGIRGSGGGGYW